MSYSDLCRTHVNLSKIVEEKNLERDFMEIVSGRGWKSLLRIEGVGKTSYYHLLSKLQMIGVVDESLDRILAGHSVGQFDNK